MAVETPESFAQSRSMSSTEIGTLTLYAGIASSLVLDSDRDKPDLSRRRGRFKPTRHTYLAASASPFRRGQTTGHGSEVLRRVGLGSARLSLAGDWLTALQTELRRSGGNSARTSRRSMPDALSTPGRTWLVEDSRAGTGDTAWRALPISRGGDQSDRFPELSLQDRTGQSRPMRCCCYIEMSWLTAT
jgi:hypothetical protein